MPLSIYGLLRERERNNDDDDGETSQHNGFRYRLEKKKKKSISLSRDILRKIKAQGLNVLCQIQQKYSLLFRTLYMTKR